MKDHAERKCPQISESDREWNTGPPMTSPVLHVLKHPAT